MRCATMMLINTRKVVSAVANNSCSNERLKIIRKYYFLAAFDENPEKLWQANHHTLYEKLEKRIADLIFEAKNQFDPEEEIEKLQNKAADERGFKINGHSLYIYADCTKNPCPHKI